MVLHCQHPAPRAAFSKRRVELLISNVVRWALFVQPADLRQPEFVGCHDAESEAC